MVESDWEMLECLSREWAGPSWRIACLNIFCSELSSLKIGVREKQRQPQRIKDSSLLCLLMAIWACSSLNIMEPPWWIWTPLPLVWSLILFYSTPTLFSHNFLPWNSRLEASTTPYMAGSLQTATQPLRNQILFLDYNSIPPHYGTNSCYKRQKTALHSLWLVLMKHLLQNFNSEASTVKYKI